jgi:YD repeat-containing protein
MNRRRRDASVRAEFHHPIAISTRRFRARPEATRFDASGRDSPAATIRTRHRRSITAHREDRQDADETGREDRGRQEEETEWDGHDQVRGRTHPIRPPRG